MRARLDGMRDEYDHIVLIDTHSSEDALEIVGVLRDGLKQARIVLLDAGCDGAAIQAALVQGANGYLARHIACLPLLLMLDLIVLGETILSRAFVDKIVMDTRPYHVLRRHQRETAHGLSERELGILECLASGEANKVIARKLGISEATVKIHIKAILRKLHVVNRTQAAIWVVNQRLSEPAEITGQSGSEILSERDQTRTGNGPWHAPSAGEAHGSQRAWI
jgi:two-component system nitrate/nitrite response regulator NarL